MSSSRSLLSSLSVCVALAATGTALAEDTDFITGKGLPNLTRWLCLTGENSRWPELGSTAGIDIDPTDGHIWAYERWVRQVLAVVCR